MLDQYARRNIINLQTRGECCCRTTPWPTPPPPIGADGKQSTKLIEYDLVMQNLNLKNYFQDVNHVASLVHQGPKAMADLWGPTHQGL